MPTSPTILFAGGGSGGHLYPGISVAQALLEIVPDAKPIFLCTTRDIDATILKHTGFEFVRQPIVPIRRTIGGLLKFWTSWRQTKDLVKSILRDRKPAAILGLGGYAAGVAVETASKRGIPAAILNPDVIPGKANQYLLQCVQKVCLQFDATRPHVPSSAQGKLETTGCPIRTDITARPSREQASANLGLDPLLHTLVITGASQGAVTVNDAVLESLKRICRDRGEGKRLQGWQILHLAGKDNAESVRAEYRALEIDASVLDFTPNMADVWSVAELAISRSGASTCAELTACHVPSVLMPYPFHADMHQLENAKVLQNAGAAEIVLDQKDRQKNADLLRPVIESLLYDAPRRKALAEGARKLARPDAARAVAQTLVEMLKSND
ncbi:MAG: UDP-N-acetylglucosamine--N-acetylmuramyl-(pentapeptide) pyrophosphoryl-undecaprenol N-acetylglucosamine transferase [Tepidisphaeraceae bacterium]